MKFWLTESWPLFRFAYWKNFTSRDSDEIAFTLETTLRIRGRVQTGEFGEVADEVRLIEISATTGDIGPVKIGARLNFDQRLLKTADPAKDLWCQAGFRPEKIDKVLVTNADLA